MNDIVDDMVYSFQRANTGLKRLEKAPPQGPK